MSGMVVSEDVLTVLSYVLHDNIALKIKLSFKRNTT